MSYKLIALADAQPGMVLSDHLLDRHGKVLLPGETVLTEKMLESLKRYDIDTIPVVGEGMTPEEKAALVQARLDRLDQLFRKQQYGNADMHANGILLDCLKAFRGGAQ